MATLSGAAVITTPTLRQAGRRARFWIVSAIVAVLLAVISIVFAGAGASSGPALSATNAAPGGSMAIAEVLKQHGVAVTATESLDATEEAAAAAAATSGTTIFVVDDNGYLDGAQLRQLGENSGHLILMTPTFDQLLSVAPEIAQAGSVTGVLKADCSLPAVRNAGSVTGTGSGYRLVPAESTDRHAESTTCLGSGDDIHSLIQLNRGQKLLTVIGTREAFTNQSVSELGNAALALNLLGSTETLIWYLPTIEDAAVPGAPTLGDLTPSWVSAVMVMLLLVAIAAAIWRSRRLGPLVIENLPVIVRASETMEGRARLYQKASARTRALDALRIGTISRLATACGLSRQSTVEEVILAVSNATGRSAAAVTALLRGTQPTTDAELIRLSDDLLDLEDDTLRAIRPS